MKGAVLDYITSVLSRIGVTTRLSYTTRYELADLADDDLVTKYLLSAIIPPPLTGFDEPFEGVSSKTITDWQSDIPEGQTASYADLLGNDLPKPFIYTGAAGAAKIKTDATITCTYTDSSEITLDTVVIDWSFNSDGKIAW